MTDTFLQPWVEAIDEFPITGTASEKLCAAARHAMLAPSSHNSQPWIFRVKGATLDVFADRSRGQPVVDPEDRELTIACGAALYIVRITLAHFGNDSGIKLLPDPRDPDLLARVTLVGAVEAPALIHRLYDAVHRRRTNRRPFTGEEIPEQVLANPRFEGEDSCCPADFGWRSDPDGRCGVPAGIRPMDAPQPEPAARWHAGSRARHGRSGLDSRADGGPTFRFGRRAGSA